MQNRLGARTPWIVLCIQLFMLFTPQALAGEVEDYVAKLKGHYKDTLSIKTFSLTHRYLGRSDPYQSWDYQAPNRYSAFKVTDVDLERKHYAQRVVHRFIGGQLIDEHHYQNDTESLRYEMNGMPLGKGVLKQSMNSFERYKNITMTSIDFLVVRPVLEEQNISDNITLVKDKNAGTTTLIHQQNNGDVIEYVFNDAPTRLLSLNNKTKRRIYIYQDYQTSDGLTFARSIVKYYGGVSVPSFISYIEHFNEIDRIEPAKLKLPEGYGPILPERDRRLYSIKIAPDLYLLTDSSAWRNQLFKIMGDEIMVFGVPRSPELAEQSLQVIREQFPQKRITSVYITHPHSDEIAGLPTYVEQGIAIRADAYTIEAIKAYPRFAEKIAEFTFDTTEHEQQLGDVRFYVLESSISKRQGFVYFQDSGIIYQADFLEIPFDNTIAKVLPSYSKTFIDFLRNKQIKFNRIVGNSRNNNISPEVVNRVYEGYMM